DMRTALTLRFAADAAIADALNLVATYGLIRGAYLSLPADGTEAAAVYAAVWRSRAALSRVEARRHRDALASADPAVADLFDRIRAACARLACPPRNPGKAADAHRREVERLTDEKEGLERQLAARLQIAAPPAPKELPEPGALLERLPDGVAFLDLVRYTHYS